MTFIEGIWLEFTGFDFTSWLGVWLYWVPLLLLAVYYVIQSVFDYWNDAAARAGSSATTAIYIPKLKIGTLVNRAVATVCPVINLWVAVFDALPFFIGHIGNWLEEIFNVPLIPDSETHKKLREEKYRKGK